MNYKDFYNRSINKPEEFWKEQSQKLNWYKEPSTILSKNDSGHYQWFEDGKLNMSYLCIDKHIEDGFGGKKCYYL